MSHAFAQRPIIQIAGVKDAAEARMVAACGATHVGFPLRLPVHEPDIDESTAAAIMAGLPANVLPVLITYLTVAEEIVAFCRELGCATVQLHGDIACEDVRRLRRLAPRLTIFKSLVVGRFEEARLCDLCTRFAPFVDAFITDTYDPRSGASGATGLTHDWAISRRLVERSSKPVVLAGGLTPANVADAIAATGCAGVDSHTGVEGDDGAKCPDKVAEFVVRARHAFCRRTATMPL